MTSISDAVNSFNSIKVQLRQSGVILFNIIPTFQFHKGTIKALSAYTPYGPLSSFNSIKVQLRLVDVDPCQLTPLTFNSIKVQLRLQEAKNKLELEGTFNSIKVQLRRR